MNPIDEDNFEKLWENLQPITRIELAIRKKKKKKELIELAKKKKRKEDDVLALSKKDMILRVRTVQSISLSHLAGVV